MFKLNRPWYFVVAALTQYYVGLLCTRYMVQCWIHEAEEDTLPTSESSQSSEGSSTGQHSVIESYETWRIGVVNGVEALAQTIQS